MFPLAHMSRCSYQDVAHHRFMPSVLLSGLRPGADQSGDDRPEQMCDTTSLQSGWVKTQSPAVSAVLLIIPGASITRHCLVLSAANFLHLCQKAVIITLGARNSITQTGGQRDRAVVAATLTTLQQRGQNHHMSTRAKRTSSTRKTIATAKPPD